MKLCVCVHVSEGLRGGEKERSRERESEGGMLNTERERGMAGGREREGERGRKEEDAGTLWRVERKKESRGD